MRQNFSRRLVTVKIAEQSSNGLDHERIRITTEETAAFEELGNKPQLGKTAGKQIFCRPKFWRERRKLSGAFDEVRETILPVFQGGQFSGELLLFFRELHGAERSSVRLRHIRTFGSRRRLGSLGGGSRRFRLRTAGFIAPLVLIAIITSRLVAAGFVATRLIPAWIALLLLRRGFAPRRLDAAQGAAKFFDLALIGELLSFGDLDEFQHFVEMINHLLERLGNLRGVLDGLGDGRGFGGTKIGGLDPRLGALRFRPALLTTVIRATIAKLFARRLGRTLRFSF